MKIRQLSVFLENKPGRLSAPCQALAAAGINILTLSLADTQQFGILRLILPDWKKAKSILEAAGCVVKVTEVVAIEVEDRPGGLAAVLAVLETAKINVEYMYAFTFKRADKAVLVFRFEDPEKAVAALRSKGINPIQDVELFQTDRR
ncbi:MAG: ACT domain-containing protein [Planctomycetota bacterium]